MTIKPEKAAPMPAPVHTFAIDGVQYSVRPYLSSISFIRLKVYCWRPGKLFGGSWHTMHHDANIWRISDYTRQTRERREFHARRAVESAIAFDKSIADLETLDLQP